jgi:hypothetical protein
MDDWTFARPLPPGTFPDEDHLSGAREAARKRDQKLGDRTSQPDQVPST